MLRKKTFLVLSALMILSISSSLAFCDEECMECSNLNIKQCSCDIFLPLPVGDDWREYEARIKSSPKSLFGLNNVIVLDGKIIANGNPTISPSEFDKIKNFDFTVFRGCFNGDGGGEGLDSMKMNNASFYGATLGKSIFYYWWFVNCDFRYANFDGADLVKCNIDASCKFKGAKINGSRIPLSQEQLLSTDPFIKERRRVNVINEVKDRVLLKNLELIESDIAYISLEHNTLRNVDFNKFNNGKRAKLPCLIRNCVFDRSFINCSFAGGKLERTTFKGNGHYNRNPLHVRTNHFNENIWQKIENCDFSFTKLIDVDFSCVPIKDSVFYDAEIQGVNFAGNVGFYNPNVFDPAAASEYDQPIKEHLYDVKYKDYYIKAEKNKIAWMMQHGLQKDQLKQTASFKKNKLINVKFCMDMSNLNLSRFNLTGCKFSGDLTNVDFSNAVITDCVFGWNTNLTMKQIESTWNYKNSQLEGITLPSDIKY
ncbi:MAG: pentapeptide repeat-containing protein [Planctomycetaceae bacterium]|jgi:uncharacterized protein YjbI with pentapeptide repeats|nr:pentapeptide repeat-containing protein [Planctomycetaceae bacterium]